MLDFGDGTTTTEYWEATHRYDADGDYTVSLTATTADGRIGTASVVVRVRTHDVAITRFTAPVTVAPGQTRLFTIAISNRRLDEYVDVDLNRSVGAAMETVRDTSIFVPARRQATNVTFEYTFTEDDARFGKVTFQVVANILWARDALPHDNEALATTNVAR